MSDATRRTFLAAAGTGAAAAAAAVAAAPGASAAPATVTAAGSAAAPTGPRLVAYVDDPRSGRLTVMYGEHEVTIQDADLVRRLTRAAGK
ncbi:MULTISPECIES: hypothetical protein [unclassified Phycicoccus]|uniref:hypothetical protein n=1 Tax=unclassified Phycicoccus TaxID=2637926 RepID=UPI00070248B2|nr:MULTISPECIES: hypothetical protein [unclassified Phycicoccus]KQU67483.1 hypothetical protein ASC58_13035 [Phycicoccus sp. Root101]KQZ90163.1 hypothetical protein ASD62_13500 [Phycicoccus sp. Root563]